MPAKLRKPGRQVPLPPCRREPGALVIVLPVPPIALRPNGQHGHWSTIRKAKRHAKTLASLRTLALLQGEGAAPASAYSLVYYFHSTPWDDDNAIASVKAYLDGIAKTLGMDDRHLRFRAIHRRTDRACPRVEIHLHLSHPTK